MKRIVLAFVLCLLLSSVCLAESSTDRFLSNLSDTWNSFLDMAGDVGKQAEEWANESGVTQWVGDRANDVAAWAKESGLTDWANDTLGQLSAWYEGSGIAEWAEGTSREIQTYIQENRPAVEAWLSEAGQEVQRAWDTLVNADQHTQEEIAEAYDIVAESLEDAAE